MFNTPATRFVLEFEGRTFGVYVGRASKASMDAAREALLHRVQKMQARSNAIANAELMESIKGLTRDEMIERRRAYTAWEDVGDELRDELLTEGAGDAASGAPTPSPAGSVEDSPQAQDTPLEAWTLDAFARLKTGADVSTLVDASVEAIESLEDHDAGEEVALQTITTKLRARREGTEALPHSSWADYLPDELWSEVARIATWMNRPRPFSTTPASKPS